MTARPMDVDPATPPPAKRQHLEDKMDEDEPQDSTAEMQIDTPTKQPATEAPVRAPLAREDALAIVPTPSTSLASVSESVSNLFSRPKKRGKKAKKEDSEELVHKSAYTQNNYYSAPSSTETWQTDLPTMLLSYSQVIFKFSLLSLGLYLVFLFIYTVLLDVAEKVDATTHEIRAEIYHCAESFAANGCLGYRDVGRVPPALWGMCSEWENCMNRDPRKIGGKARLGAETVAEIVNGFVDVISWKTMIFILAAIATIIYVTNSAITTYKHHNMPLYAHTPYESREIHAMPAIHSRLSSSGLTAVQNHQFNPALPKESREVNSHLHQQQREAKSKKGWLW